MGTYAKSLILFLLLVYLGPFVGRVKGLKHGVNSATNEDMIEVKMRKLIVDIQRDYTPGHSNNKHDPAPPAPKGKSGTSAGSGS